MLDGLLASLDRAVASPPTPRSKEDRQIGFFDAPSSARIIFMASVRSVELIEPPIVGDFTDRREAAFFFYPRFKQALESWTIS